MLNRASEATSRHSGTIVCFTTFDIYCAIVPQLALLARFLLSIKDCVALPWGTADPATGDLVSPHVPRLPT